MRDDESDLDASDGVLVRRRLNLGDSAAADDGGDFSDTPLSESRFWGEEPEENGPLDVEPSNAGGSGDSSDEEEQVAPFAGKKGKAAATTATGSKG